MSYLNASPYTALCTKFGNGITKQSLDCLVLSVFVVWTKLATSQDHLRRKILKQFCPASKCGVNWVLSCPDPVSNMVSYCDVIFGSNWIKTSSQMRSHRRRDWTKLFCLQYIENCLWLSRTQFTPPTRQDKTVLSCQCWQCELAITFIETGHDQRTHRRECWRRWQSPEMNKAQDHTVWWGIISSLYSLRN